MNTKTIIFGVIGFVLLIWIVKKMQPGETQTITQLVPVGSAPNTSNTDAHINYDANKTAAFLGFLDLGKQQIAANIQSKNIDTQLPLEQIRADTVNRQTQAQVELGGLSSKTAIQLASLQTDAQLQQTKAAIEAANQQLALQLNARQAQQEQASSAINSAAITYRNQSLERQGVILNALTTLYTGQAPYNYQSAFGKVNTPVLQQLFPNGIGDTLKGLFGLF